MRSKRPRCLPIWHRILNDITGSSCFAWLIFDWRHQMPRICIALTRVGLHAEFVMVAFAKPTANFGDARAEPSISDTKRVDLISRRHVISASLVQSAPPLLGEGKGTARRNCPNAQQYPQRPPVHHGWKLVEARRKPTGHIPSDAVRMGSAAGPASLQVRTEFKISCWTRAHPPRCTCGMPLTATRNLRYYSVAMNFVSSVSLHVYTSVPA